MAFVMDFKRLPRCAAKARSNFNLPCRQAAMKNGRCYWHGGSAHIKHGHYTKTSKTERRSQRHFINEIRRTNLTLKNLL